MFLTKSKYPKNSAQFWLLQVVLFFSVFAFSGFNEKIQNAFLESVKTELVEVENYRPTLEIKDFSKDSSRPAILKSTLADLYTFNYQWFLLHFHQLVYVKYRVICQQFLSYSYTTIQLPIKLLPSSSTEDLLSYFG